MASKALFVLRSNATPCRLLVPDLMLTLIAAPPAAPNSASNELVLTTTVSMASGDGTYATLTGSPGRSEEHTSEPQSLRHRLCRLLLEKKIESENVYVTAAWVSTSRNSHQPRRTL